jgi:hypothetical protein
MYWGLAISGEIYHGRPPGDYYSRSTRAGLPAPLDFD